MKNLFIFLSVLLTSLTVNAADLTTESIDGCDDVDLPTLLKSNNYVCMTYQGSKYIAYTNPLKQQGHWALTVMQEKIGGKWEPLGLIDFAACSSENINFYISEKVPYVTHTYKQGSNTCINVMKFNGTTWTKIKIDDKDFCTNDIGSISLYVEQNIMYLAYAANDDTLNAVKYNLINGSKKTWKAINDEPYSSEQIKHDDESLRSIYTYRNSDHYLYIGYQAGHLYMGGGRYSTYIRRLQDEFNKNSTWKIAFQRIQKIDDYTKKGQPFGKGIIKLTTWEEWKKFADETLKHTVVKSN